MKTVNLLGVGLTTVMFASLIVGCGGPTQGNPPNTASPQELTLSLDSEPDSLDSSKATSVISFDTLSLAFEGLTRLDKNGKPVPGVAEKWEHSADYKTWTFHLRKDAKWSDGAPVTANDFVYALLRTLDKKSDSEYEFMAAWVKNGDAYNAGKAKVEDVGIKAQDDYTLVYTLDHPIPFFDTQTSFAVFYPQNQKAVQAAGDKYGTEAGTLIGNGPWKIDNWTHSQNIVLSKNPNYWDKGSKDRFTLTKITLDMITDENTRLNVYQSGDLDRSLIEKDQVDKFKNSSEYSTVNQLVTNYLEFNKDKAPVLANAKVRRALVWAVDRNAFADAIYHNGTIGATGLIPNGTSDGNGGDYRKNAGDVIGQHTPDDSKALLNEGLKELGMTTMPKITLLGDDTSTGKKIVQFLQDQWKANLGINVDLDVVPFKDRLKRAQKGDYQIVASLWGADYNDPMTFMDMWVSDSPFNEVRYNNADYDKAIKDAQQQADLAKRAQDFVTAEKILMNDMPIGPLVFRSRAYVTKSYVKNFVAFPAGTEWTLDYTTISGKKK